MLESSSWLAPGLSIGAGGDWLRWPHNSTDNKAAGDREGVQSHPAPPRRLGELQEPFAGTAAAGSEPRSIRLAPFTGHPARAANAVTGFFQPAFTSEFCCAANPCPLKTSAVLPPRPSPFKTPSPLGPGHVYQKPPFVGGVERGLTLSSVLSSHMEFRRPQRSRASIWRAQELRASPSCPHGSCACSPRTKLIRGFVRMLGGCSVLSWRSPEIKPPQEGCSQKKASHLAACTNG